MQQDERQNQFAPVMRFSLRLPLRVTLLFFVFSCHEHYPERNTLAGTEVVIPGSMQTTKNKDGAIIDDGIARQNVLYRG